MLDRFLADCLIQLKSSIAGTIKIIHQHAEETPPGGAKSIVESGVLDDVDAIFGIHLFPTNPTGDVGYRSGYAMAGRTYFKLKINGVGVVTIGSFDGKGAFNVIKDSVELEGDVRYMTGKHSS